MFRASGNTRIEEICPQNFDCEPWQHSLRNSFVINMRMNIFQNCSNFSVYTSSDKHVIIPSHMKLVKVVKNNKMSQTVTKVIESHKRSLIVTKSSK